MPSRASCLILVAILALTGLVHFLTLREGQHWPDDFALYILHARNLATGVPYAETGYLYNPQNPSYSPRTYPPIFPLLLSPLYAWFGLNYTVMKAAIIAMFLCLLVASWWSFRDELPRAGVLGLVALLGLHPYFASFKEDVNSDILFTFFLVVCLGTHARLSSLPDPRWWHGVVVGLLLYLAYGTRSVGLILVPSVALADVILRRKLTSACIAGMNVFAVLMFAQSMFVHSESSYLDQLKNPTVTIQRNILLYAGAFFDLWGKGSGFIKLFRVALVCSLLGLALVGFVSKLWERLSAFHVFPVLYVVAILTWPAYPGARYLIPLLPLLLYFAVAGFVHCAESWPAGLRIGAAAALSLALGAAYLTDYARLETGPIVRGPTAPGAQEVFSFIRDHTQPNDVIVFRRARALTLYTSRRASVYHVTGDNELWAYLRRIQTTHIVVSPGQFDGFQDDTLFLEPFVSRHARRLDQVYGNHRFKVYRIKW